MTTAAVDATQVLPAHADRARWLAARRHGLGGSDVSTLVGLNRWSSRYELYLDKIGELPLVDEQSEAAEMGQLLEPVVCGRFARVHQLDVAYVGMLRSNRWPWMVATPDGLCSDGAGYEGKTCSVWQAHEWADGQTADHAELQAQWGMAVTGLTGWWVAVLIGGQHNEYRFIRRDPELIDELVAIGDRFWHEHVEARVPPPLDGSAAATALLTERYPRTGGGEVEIDRDERDEIVLLREQTRAAEKAAEADSNALKNRVRALVGSAERLVHGDDVIATWRNTGKFAESRFRAEHPDLAAGYTTQVEAIDTERLAVEHPELYRQYRARVLTFKN